VGLTPPWSSLLRLAITPEVLLVEIGNCRVHTTSVDKIKKRKRDTMQRMCIVVSNIYFENYIKLYNLICLLTLISSS
jgi:hypothetical protein